jgi:hypothetical protein
MTRNHLGHGEYIDFIRLWPSSRISSATRKCGTHCEVVTKRSWIWKWRKESLMTSIESARACVTLNQGIGRYFDAHGRLRPNYALASSLMKLSTVITWWWYRMSVSWNDEVLTLDHVFVTQKKSMMINKRFRELRSWKEIISPTHESQRKGGGITWHMVLLWGWNQTFPDRDVFRIDMNGDQVILSVQAVTLWLDGSCDRTGYEIALFDWFDKQNRKLLVGRICASIEMLQHELDFEGRCSEVISLDCWIWA